MTKAEEFIEFLIDSRASNLPATALADILDGLIWTMADNGGEICRVREKWLLGDDAYRIEVSLEMRNVFPFTRHSDMLVALQRIKDQWPQFGKTCDEIITRRQAQGAIE